MSKKNVDPKSSDRREQVRAQQSAAAKADSRRASLWRTGIILGVLAAVVVVAVIAVASKNQPESGGANPTGSQDGDAGYGIVVGDGPVTVDVWEDFQCPGCGSFERSGGSDILDKIVQDGSATVIYHPLSFLDNNLRNDASSRATNAAGCAADQGKFVEFHRTVFANQPAQEGTGWTDDQLLAFGTAVGVDAATFAPCVANQTYADWVDRVARSMIDAGVTGTPTIFVDGKKLSEPTPANLEKAVAER